MFAEERGLRLQFSGKLRKAQRKSGHLELTYYPIGSCGQCAGLLPRCDSHSAPQPTRPNNENRNRAGIDREAAPYWCVRDRAARSPRARRHGRWLKRRRSASRMPPVEPDEFSYHHGVSQKVSQTLMSELNVRIDPEMAALLERVAQQTGRTKSEVVREALETLRARGAHGAATPPAKTMARLIGCWDSGGARLSERTGERFAQLLQERKDAQRTDRRRPARRAD
jgi:Arc/MetJ-type ribon-helix-helix transcriptional regulator